MLKAKKAILDQRVAAGTLTQERANEIMAALEANQANCDGTGGGRIGQKMGAGFGGGMGSRQGRGQGASGFGQGICGGVAQ